MAINKKLIHFNTFENFNSKKLSANVENTKYTLGVNGEIQIGTPDILYQSIVYIKDTKQQWTHGQLYNNTFVEITYSDLVNLKENNKLIPGCKYKIIDYVTQVTSIPNIKLTSNEHPFDIIVIADSINTLNENASACIKQGDDYFINNNLQSWKLKYCIDNDKTKFTWVKDTIDEGAIFNNTTYTRDQSLDKIINNIKYYAFVNKSDQIYSKVLKPTSSDSVFLYSNDYFYGEEMTMNGSFSGYCEKQIGSRGIIYYMQDEFGNEAPYDFKNILINSKYTFGDTIDDTILGDSQYNKINNIYDSQGLLTINNIILGNSCSYNTFESNCKNITLGNSCQYNTFDFECSNISLGFNSNKNSFGKRCSDMILGTSLSNTFGSLCRENIFGSNCNYNTLGEACINNTFENNVQFATLGKYCYNNTILSGQYYEIISGTIDKTISSSNPLNIIKISYEELVILKNNNQLIPGMKYRIIDYVTMCNNNGCNNLNIITESEMHPFDILIQASSTNSLCENASLLLNEEDSYFNNINLSKFEIKYDINNDSSKYLWADTKYGKGVIYYMKDEFMNECCYDFLNITFTFTNDYLFTGSTDEFRSNVKYYTFSHENNSIITRNDSYFCHSNIIKQSFLNGALLLNCNLFKTISNTWVSSNFLDENCFENKFGPDCYRNILGKNCYGNNFLQSSKYNNFGNNCSYNHLSKNCSFISLEGNCYNNTFNEQCQFITAGKSLYMCNLGKNCAGNSFRNNCYNITLGNYSAGNQFMNNCQNVVFGEYSSYNVFENNCLNITMRVNASTSGTSLGYFQYNKISSGTQNVTFYTGVTTSSSKKISNIHVKLGIYGSTSSPKYINVSTLINRTYETIITKNSSNEIKFNIVDEKQDILISGTNIKTINGESILGSGNIIIEGSNSSNCMQKIPIVRYTINNDSCIVQPDTRTYITCDGNVNINLERYEEDNFVHSYEIVLIMGDAAYTVSFPENITWTKPLTITENKRYYIIIEDNFAIFTEI